MTADEDHLGRFEPLSWLLLFQAQSTVWWVDRIPGRFKHVAAFGWVEASKVWLQYEIGICRTSVRALPEADGIDLIARLAGADGAAMLRVPVVRAPAPRLRFGLWCVPAIKHLLGLRSGALRPDGLWSDCLATGTAEIVHGARSKTIRADA